MSATTVADFSVLKPEIYGPLTQTKIAQAVDFFMNGMCDRVALPAGEFVPFPGFKALSGDPDRMVDGGTYDINKIDPLKDIAVVLHKIKVFGAEDLVQIVTGQDPNAEIARQLAIYFARKVISPALMSVLKGVFATSGPLNSTNLHSVYVDAAFSGGTQVPMSPAVAAAGLAKLGDEMNNVAGWVMHSKVYADLLAAGYISTATKADPYGIGMNGELMSFMGKPIVMADNGYTLAGTHATKYRTLGIARGALAYGVQKDANPEQDRDRKDKLNFVSTDIHFAPHVRGCAYNTAVGANPTTANLELGTSWTLAAEDEKFVGVVAIDTN